MASAALRAAALMALLLPGPAWKARGDNVASAIVKLRPAPLGLAAREEIPPGLEPLAPQRPPGPAARGGAAAGVLDGFWLLRADTPEALARRIQWLRTRGDVDYVAPNPAVRLFATRVDDPRGGSRLFPNDFEFASQFSLHNEGMGGGLADADIDAPEAWVLRTSATNLTVAVIDTGIDFHHPDLEPNIWVNPGEIPGNGLDDDGNGFVDDIHGHNFAGSSPDPFDDNGHGTHVAGIIGARGDDRRGVAGVCWEARLMAVKAFDAGGNSRLSDVLRAVDYAVANGAQIINASWGVDEENQALADVVAAVVARGVLVVAAAGNEKTDVPSFPAALPGVVAVAATDGQDQRAVFSNFGPWISLAAPGEGVLSTLPHGGHGRLSGTSMSAPHVAGVAALVWSANRDFSRREVADILLNTCDPLATDKALGRGRLNAFKALSAKTPPPRLELQTPPKEIRGLTPLLGTVGAPVEQWRVEVASGPAFTHWVAVGSGSAPVADGVLANLDTSILPEGAVKIRLTALTRNGPQAQVESSTTVRNFALTAPVSSDVLPFIQGELRVVGRAYGTGVQIELSHATGFASTQWTNRGVTTFPIPELSASEMTLATINATAVTRGDYVTLRLRVASAHSTNTLYAENIHLDASLREGFPIRLPSLEDRDPPVEDWRDARPADLDGDGRMEIVITQAPSPSTGEARVLAFKGDGALLWSHGVAEAEFQADIPAIGDVNGDGRLEVFFDFDHSIRALRSDGTPLGGVWPVATSGALHGKSVAEVVGDSPGLELVAFANLAFPQNGSWWRELLVLGADGQPLRRWVTPDCDYTNDVRRIHAAVGSFHADGPARIVVPWGCGAVACFDPAGTGAAPLWIAPASGRILSTPLLADLDGNGEREVVVAAAASREGALDGGVYVFDAEGRLKRGWPALEGELLTSQPAAGDLNGDGTLELAVVSDGGHALHLLEADGFELEGFPVSLSKVSAKTGPVFGHFRGLGSRVILSMAGYPRLAANGKDPAYLGGVVGWNSFGARAPLIAADSRTLLPTEGATKAALFKTAPPALADLDGDGLVDLLATSVEERANSVLAASMDALKRRAGIYAWSTHFGQDERPAWPMFAHDVANTSCQELAATPPPPPADGVRRDRVATFEDTPVKLDVTANDYPLGAWRVESFTQPSHGVVTGAAAGRLLYSPARDFHGMDRFQYEAIHLNGERAVGQVEIRVRPVNDPPSARLTEVTLNRNTSADVFYNTSDPEGSKLTFRVVQGPSNGELFAYPTIGAYYPRKGFSGVDFYHYTASDGDLESGWAQVVLRVTATNNPPKAMAERVTVRSGFASETRLRGVDADGDALTFRIATPPAHGVATLEDGVLRYRPGDSYLGPDRMAVVASDGQSDSAEASIDILVTRGNGIPEAIPAHVETTPNQTVEITLAGRDRDGQALALRIVHPPLYGRLEGEVPRVVYHPPDGFEGIDRFEFVADDGEDESLLATVRVTVSRANHAPELGEAQFTTQMGKAVDFILEASDLDGDALALHLLSNGRLGSARRAPPGWRYTPNSGASGEDELVFAAWDGREWSAPAAIEIKIEGEEGGLGGALTLRASLTALEGGDPALRLEVLGAAAGAGLRLEQSGDLLQWKDAGEIPTGPGGRRVLLVPLPPGGGGRFFRAVMAEP